MNAPEKAVAATAEQPGNPPTLEKDADGWPVFPPGRPAIQLWGNYGTPMARVAARMKSVGDLLQLLAGTNQVDRPIVDKTGLTGIYDFTVTFLPRNAIEVNPNAPPEPPAAQANAADTAREPAPDLDAALATQLGLKLVSTKGPVKVLVVDRVNDKPTDN